MPKTDRTIFPAAGAACILALGLRHLDVECRLAVVWPPLGDSLEADDLIEPVGGGYRRGLIPGDAWQITASPQPRAVGPILEFAFTGVLDDPRSQVVGQAFVDRTSGQLLWASRLERPIWWTTPGVIEVLPELSLVAPE